LDPRYQKAATTANRATDRTTGIVDPHLAAKQGKAPVRKSDPVEFSEPCPSLDSNFTNILIIAGLPVVDESKASKLSDFLKRDFLRVLPNAIFVDVYMHTVNKKSLG